MRLSHRFALTGVLAALLPLIVFGGVALHSLRTATRQSVGQGLAALTTRTAAHFDLWLSRTTALVVALAAEFDGTGLSPAQQQRALRNYVLAFPELREIAVVTADGRLVASSRLDPRATAGLLLAHAGEDVPPGVVRISDVVVDDDLLPTVTVTVRVGEDGRRVIATLGLEEMWRVVDTLRVGANGHALLADASGRLLAHGAPEQKARIARGERVDLHPIVARTAAAGPVPIEYADGAGEWQLGAAARVQATGWWVVVEQPTREAYALERRLGGVLLAAMAVAAAIMVALGVWLGRSLIDPIGVLVEGAGAIAAGRLDTRVTLRRDDEFKQLADAFNEMAARLADLQETTRRQERQALFGRLAAGLVHDLSHPVQNLVNSWRLLRRQPGDADAQAMFARAMDRETTNLRRVLEDLRQLARPSPLERFPVDVARQLREAAEGLRPSAEALGVAIEVDAPASLLVLGDAFALERVWRNLLQNAVEATPGGHVLLRLAHEGDEAVVTVADDGPGFAPELLERLFDEFVTTKRRGLGLGLAISRQIVDQLGGRIRAWNAARGAVVEARLAVATAAVDDTTAVRGKDDRRAGEN